MVKEYPPQTQSNTAPHSPPLQSGDPLLKILRERLKALIF